jgi:hypothetical protein
MTLEEQITDLTRKWYTYVSVEHHKDRDCHFWIEKTWSYGEPPKYSAHHHGYIGKYYDTQKFDTEEDAMLWLIAKLKNEIEGAIRYLERTEYWDENDKIGFPAYELSGLTESKANDIIKMLKAEAQ